MSEERMKQGKAETFEYLKRGKEERISYKKKSGIYFLAFNHLINSWI